MLVISATQDETFTLCERKWYFGWHLKLPQTDRGYKNFGTVLHSVIERYLTSEITASPQLYPEGWDKEGGLDPEEYLLIKKLVSKALEEGIIRKLPGQKVEHEFRRYLIEGVQIVGYIDILNADGIEDNKSTKNMRYAKTEKSLAKNTQVLTYCMERLLLDEEQGLPPKDRLSVRHNIFCKDPEEQIVKCVETTVSRKEIEDNWERLKKVALKMLEKKKVKSFWEIYAPTTSGACNAFGGCPFIPICSKQESVQFYTQRVARINEQKDKQDMGLLDKLKAQVSGNVPSVQVAEVPREAPPNPLAQILGAKPPVPTAVSTVPPWANPACVACEGSGFNSKGNVCRICADWSVSKGGVNPFDFQISASPSGPVWSQKDTPPTAQAATVLAAPQIATAPAAPPAPVEAPAEAPRPVGRPRKTAGAPVTATSTTGFDLLIHCNVIKGNWEVVHLEDVLLVLGEQLAKDNGSANYYALDAFKRRDMLCSKARQIVAEFFGKIVCVSVRSPDLDALVSALMPFADKVVMG